MSGFRSLNNSTSKKVLNLLEPVKLTVWKVMIQRVTVVKFRVNYGGGNGAGCFEVKVRADTGSIRIMDHSVSYILYSTSRLLLLLLVLEVQFLAVHLMRLMADVKYVLRRHKAVKLLVQLGGAGAI